MVNDVRRFGGDFAETDAVPIRTVSKKERENTKEERGEDDCPNA
jgi:hypothetical protein